MEITTTLWLSVIAAVFVIGIVAFWWFRPKADHVTKMGPYVLRGDDGKPKPNSTISIFNQAEMTTSLGNNFTLSFFVYMDDVNRERIPIAGPAGDFRFKPFLFLLGVGDILLDPIHQMARVRIKPLTQQRPPKPPLTRPWPLRCSTQTQHKLYQPQWAAQKD